MRDFDRQAKGDSEVYHRLQEEYLTKHNINPTYINQEIERLNSEIAEFQKKASDTTGQSENRAAENTEEASSVE